MSNLLLETTFGTSTEALYDAATLTYTLCDRNIAAFAAYRSVYTPAYIATKVLNLEAAQALPDFPNRMERRKILRDDATILLEDGLQNWRDLEGYIEHTWPKGAIRDAKLASAGKASYLDATQKSWDAAGKLLNAGNDFIIANENDLMSNENMPKTFQDKFAKTYVEFTTKLKSYVAEDSVKVEDSSEKQKANNAVYASVQAICRDAQRACSKNPIIKNQFVFRKLVIAAGHVGVAGATGIITTGAGTDIKVLTDVYVTVLNSKSVSETNVKGRYRLKQLSSGEKTLVFSKAGYETLYKTVKIKKSVSSRFNVTLIPAVAQLVANPSGLMIVAA